MRAGKKSEQAVLAAAVAWVEFLKTVKIKPDEMTDTPARELVHAVEKYEETQKAIANLAGGKEPGAAEMEWTCPHCEAVRPAFGWHYNLGDAGPFALQWVTCFCGECKNILTVNVVQFLPKPELAEQLKAQFAGKIGLA